jgi:hypothetical protein
VQIVVEQPGHNNNLCGGDHNVICSKIYAHAPKAFPPRTSFQNVFGNTQIVAHRVIGSGNACTASDSPSNEPRAATHKKLQGARPNISQRHGLCAHNRTYNLDYVLSDLQLSSIKKGLKIFRRET